MLRAGETVRIIYSQKLLEMKLVFLCGQRGEVTKCLFGNRTPGVLVLITSKGKAFGEEWFIPLQSIQSAADIGKAHNRAILSNLEL